MQMTKFDALHVFPAVGKGACAALEERWMLSLHDGIAADSPQGRVMLRAPLEGAGALCVNENSLFCADQSGTIWQFDRATMMPRTLGSGGPGICSMCLSPCGTRLYALITRSVSLL